MKRIKPKAETAKPKPAKRVTRQPSVERAASSKAVECKFCGHFYLEPCDATKAKKCLNIRVKKPKQ